MKVLCLELPETVGRAHVGPTVLMIVIIERENLDRMREGDPVDLQPQAYASAGFNMALPLSSLDLVIAYEEDSTKILELAGNRDLPGLLRYLERGRVHRPEQGDTTPPVSLITNDKDGN